MRVIIVGAGEIGFNLARALSNKRHDVVVIEENKERCRVIADELNAMVINGDATDQAILKEAGVTEAKYLVTVTPSPEINLLSCLIAREMTSEIKLITRCARKEYRRIFEKIGVDKIVSPELTISTQLEKIITEPEFLDILELEEMYKQGIKILDMVLNKDSKLTNKLVKELQLPKESIIIAVRRGNNFMLPSAETKLMVGDKIFLITNEDMEKEVKRLF